MPSFPSPPAMEGLTFLRIVPCVFRDRRGGTLRTTVFPVYHYANAKRELILVCEDQYEPILDRLMAIGAFRPDGGAK